MPLSPTSPVANTSTMPTTTPPSSSSQPPSTPPPTTLQQILSSVQELVGEIKVQNFRTALSLILKSSLGDVPDIVPLNEANQILVDLLTEIPEEKQSGPGFAELLLAYGKALLGLVRKAQMEAGLLGDAAKKVAGTDEEEDVMEEDDEELAWTQLETARVMFEKCDGMEDRLGEVHATLGNLLLESDSWEGSAREFGRAAELLKGRARAEVLYKKYLALRRDQPAEALETLRVSITQFESAVDGEEGEGCTLKDMRQELQAFAKALKLPESTGKNKEAEPVTVVQPRKRARKERES